MAVSQEFILAGHAIFTIEEPNGIHHTWKVTHKDASDDGRYKEAYFVALLTGPDNTSDYTYVGMLDAFTGQVKPTRNSTFTADTYTLRLLNRILARIWTDDHNAYEIHGYKTHHEGRCGRCGRTLTVPESIEHGIGPECAKIMAGEEMINIADLVY